MPMIAAATDDVVTVAIIYKQRRRRENFSKLLPSMLCLSRAHRERSTSVCMHNAVACAVYARLVLGKGQHNRWIVHVDEVELST